MSKKTLKVRNQEFLESQGWTVDPNPRTNKYLVMRHPSKDFRYFLGNAGAVRRGRTVTASFSVKLKIDGGKAPTKAQQLVAEPEAEQRPDPYQDSMSSSAAADPSSTNTLTPAPASEIPATSTSTLASALQGIAGQLAQDNADGLVAGWKPTDEQRAVLDAAVTPGLRCLVLPAGAGAGKTSTLKMLEETLPGQGQYTAFNRSLVQESKSKFKKAKCSTTHGLAYATVGKRFASRLDSPRMRSEQVAQRLGISDLSICVGTSSDGKPALRLLKAGWLAGQVTQAIRRFCQSADERIGREHIKYIDGIDQPSADGKRTYGNNDVVRDYLLPFVEKAWADLSSPTGQLPFNHDVYVKLWQLGKGPNKPVIPADYILLDEAQDTAPVFLDVLKQQTHALLIFVGDSNQAIYEWRGAVDAMRAFPDAPRKMLSQSFRFGPRIADVANSILAGLDEPTDLLLKGLDSVPSVVLLREPAANVKCVLTRTNAAAVSSVMNAIQDGKRTHLVASVDEVLAFVRAARDLQQGKPISHPELGCFSKWSEVVEHSKEDEGQDLRLWVKLIEEFTTASIIDALEAQVPEAHADLVVCTAHKSKGREWDSVRLAGDFPPACKMQDSDRRLLYVAATRAKRLLDISGCPPFQVFRDKETGEETPGIKVNFTGPMPEAVGVDETPQHQVQQPTAPAQTVTGGNGQPHNGKVTEFTWANYNGKWCVGGPAGHENQTVQVVRRNGSRSQERLGRVMRDFGDRTIYATA